MKRKAKKEEKILIVDVICLSVCRRDSIQALNIANKGVQIAYLFYLFGLFNL